MRNKVHVEVVEVRGHCPVHKVGDRFAIDVHKIARDSINCEALCYHALSAIYGAYFMSRAEIAEGESFAQCFDTGPPYAPTPLPVGRASSPPGTGMRLRLGVAGWKPALLVQPGRAKARPLHRGGSAFVVHEHRA